MNNPRGIALMIGAMAGFAVTDSFIKIASREVSSGVVISALGLGGALIFGAILWRRGERLLSPVFFHRALLIRNAAEMLGTAAMISALALVPLALLTTILSATPLVVVAGAALVYGEPVGWRRWCAIFVGFLGVVIAVQPGSSGISTGILVALVAMVSLAARDLAVRSVPRAINTIQIAFFGVLSIAPVGLVMMALTPADTITLHAGLFLLASIVTGNFSYYLITEAMRTGDVSVVSPFRYTRVVFGGALGLLVFGEVLGAPLLIGAAIIVISGLYSWYRELRVRDA